MYASFAPETFEKIQNNRLGFHALDLRFNIRSELAESSRNDAGCYKVAYGSKAHAHERMRQINALPSFRRAKTLRNAYRCQHCDSWHLTSGVLFPSKGGTHA